MYIEPRKKYHDKTPHILIPEFKEIDCGDTTGMTQSEVREKYPALVAEWPKNTDPPFPGGESLKDVEVRALPKFKEIIRRNHGKVVLLVGHGALNIAIIGNLLGITPGLRFKIKQSNCCMNEIVFRGNDFNIGFINKIPPSTKTFLKSKTIPTDVVVPVWNLQKLTKRFLDSLENQKGIRAIIIDNGSGIETKKILQKYAKRNRKTIIIENNKNLGYIKAVNQGITISTAPTVFLANNDTVLPDNLIVKLRKGLIRWDIVSALSNNSGGTPDERLVNFPYTPTVNNINTFAKELLSRYKDDSIAVDFVFGHCMMMRREVIDKIGLLDERFGVGNYDDVDYCRRATNNGLSVGLLKDAFIYHKVHATFDAIGADVEIIIEKNREKYAEKFDSKT